MGKVEGIMGAQSKGTEQAQRVSEDVQRRWQEAAPKGEWELISQGDMRREFWTGKSMHGRRTSVRENAGCGKETKGLSDNWAGLAWWVEKKKSYRELSQQGATCPYYVLFKFLTHRIHECNNKWWLYVTEVWNNLL